MKAARRVGIVLYDDFQALDVSGPLDVFSTANAVAGGATPPYELLVLGVKKGAVVAESGLKVLPDAVMEAARGLDTVIVPGGSGLRLDPRVRGAVASWIEAGAGRIRRIASVCTGIYALAQSGLLDGRRATTHWRFADDVASRWPAVCLDPNAIFIRDGRYYTSAGITAGIDLALGLVEEDLGNAIALAVARELVVYVKRSGGQLQYSEPLRLQTHALGGFSDIVAWMHDNLSSDLSVESLGEHMHLSARHISRKFKAAFGCTPADFVERLRLDQSRWLLTNRDVPIESVAASIGYRSADAFRRAFERRFGLAPSDYRGRFAARDPRARLPNP